MATTGENMVKKTSSEPNIPGERISRNHVMLKKIMINIVKDKVDLTKGSF